LDLQNRRKLEMSGISAIVITILFISPLLSTVSANSSSVSPASNDIFTANPTYLYAGSGVTPNNVNGFAPYCHGGLIFCYTPAELAKAYNFPPTTGKDALTGKGSTIVIVDAIGSPTLQSDINTYDAAFGLPPITINILCAPTWTGSPHDQCPTIVPGSALDNLCGEEGWAVETTLDVSMAHALAPGAKIDLVVANSCTDQAIYQAELAVFLQPRLAGSIMSQSFGEPDYLAGCSATVCTTYNSTIVDRADLGYLLGTFNRWTIMASSGDDGATEDFTSSGFTDATLTPAWPSTNPLNLAVGGTMGNPYYGQYTGQTPPYSCPAFTNCDTGLVILNGGPSGCGTGSSLLPSGCIPVGYGGEQTWNEFNTFGVRTSSGGGVSVIYGEPFYQFGLSASYTTLLGATVGVTGRTTPDVSFNAAINGGSLIYLGFMSLFGAPNGFYIVGGTSAASPAWAAIIALLDQKHGGPVGFVNPSIYALGESKYYNSAFHDITSGNNSDTAGAYGIDGFTAGPGYDLTTGWGTPNVSNFLVDIMHFLA